MSDPSTELEERLTRALADGAQAAPSAAGLAAGARTRARQRRRSHLAVAGVVAALAIGVPTAVLAMGGTDGTDPGRGPSGTPSVAADPPGPLATGYRWESWHGVTIQVPKSWQDGSLSDWCADGGDPDVPRIQRPADVGKPAHCQPGSTFGLSFQAIDNKDDFEWPIVHQSGAGWPQGNVSGGRGIGGVLVTVTTRTADEAAYVLGSMRAIPATGDPNGCQSRLEAGATNPPEGALSVCRYDETGALEQSAALVGEDAGNAVRALQAAPEPGDCSDTSTGSEPHQVVVMEGAGITARVDLVSSCPRVTVNGQVRELSPDVAHWALASGAP